MQTTGPWPLAGEGVLVKFHPPTPASSSEKAGQHAGGRRPPGGSSRHGSRWPVSARPGCGACASVGRAALQDLMRSE